MSDATYIAISKLVAGDKITVTMVDGAQHLGDYAGCDGVHLMVESQASRRGVACLVLGIKTIKAHAAVGPCATFAGTARRCTSCGMLARVHVGA